MFGAERRPFTLDEVPLARKRAIVFLFFPFHLPGQNWAQFHGYIQGRFTNQEGTPDRLEIRRARLIVSGDPISNLSYTVQVDVVKLPYLMDAAVTWKISRRLRVTGGQFKIPFSTESLVSDNVNIPIARARAVNGLVPGRDTGVQGRDMGVQVAGNWSRGNGPLAEYAAGVFRGQLLVNSPNVHYQATAGQALLHPLRGLTAGGDWYASFSAPPKSEKRRWEAEGGYEHGPLWLRAEQIWARDGSLDRRGGYALGAWRVSRRWETLTRADWLTSNVQKINATSIVYIAGLNFLGGKHVKVGVNSGAQHDQGPKGFSSVFLAQTMVGF